MPTGESDHMGLLNLVKAFGLNSKVCETGGGGVARVKLI